MSILEAVGNLALEDFLSMQRELHFALLWWSEGSSSASSHMASCEHRHLIKREASDFVSNGDNRVRMIAGSELYDAIRLRIREDFPEQRNLPLDWLGIIARNREKDPVSSLRAAISVLMREMMPLYGSGGNVTHEEVRHAHEVITRHGISKVFVPCRNSDEVNSVFLSRWCTRAKA